MESHVKVPEEERQYEFRFSEFPEIKGGDALAGAPEMLGDVSGLTIGALVIQGSTVTVEIGGGTDGETHKLRVLCPTAAGRKLAVRGEIIISEWGGE